MHMYDSSNLYPIATDLTPFHKLRPELYVVGLYYNISFFESKFRKKLNTYIIWQNETFHKYSTERYCQHWLISAQKIYPIQMTV